MTAAGATFGARVPSRAFLLWPELIARVPLFWCSRCGEPYPGPADLSEPYYAGDGKLWVHGGIFLGLGHRGRMTEPTQTAPEKSRVTSIHVARVYNLGNYENRRVEVTVAVGADDDPARVLRTLDGILGNLYAKHGLMGHSVREAQAALAKPPEELSEYEREMLPKFRERVERVEEAKRRRAAAREALSTLEHSSEHKDHKLDWSDDGDFYYD